MNPFWKLPHKHNLMIRGVALILRHYWGSLGLTTPDPHNPLHQHLLGSLWDHIEVVGPSPFVKGHSPSDGAIRRLYNQDVHHNLSFPDPKGLVCWVGESIFKSSGMDSGGDYPLTQEELVVSLCANICFKPFGKEMSRDVAAVRAWMEYLTQGSLVAHFKTAVDADSWLPVWLVREIARIRINVSPSDDASDAYHLVHHRYGDLWEDGAAQDRGTLCRERVQQEVVRTGRMPNREFVERVISPPPPIPLPPAGTIL